jgi:hypothetical protein
MTVSRGTDGDLKCKLSGCSYSVTGSINSLVNHLKITHNIEATYEAKGVPMLPWPAVNADDLLKWVQEKRKGNAPRVEFPPSHSRSAPSHQGIRATHAVGQPSPQPFSHAPRGPGMDKVGLPSAPSSARDDVPPPHTPLKLWPAAALSESQLHRSAAADLRQQNQPVFQVNEFQCVPLQKD